MKKLRSAYISATEGKPIPEKLSGAQRIAHRLGQKTLAKNTEITNELNKQMQGRLHEAVSQSVGVNQQALELIELAAKIPNQSSTKPDWGYEKIDDDGTRSHEWVTTLSSGPDRDSSRPGKTPLVESLGSLRIDSTDWSHNGFVLPVDNLLVVCTAPIDDIGNVQPAATTIHFNTRPYDPDNIILDDKAEFKGGVKVTLSPDGHITEFGMTRSDSTGYTGEDPTKVQVDLSSFFDNAQQAVAKTINAYQSIPDSPN